MILKEQYNEYKSLGVKGEVNYINIKTVSENQLSQKIEFHIIMQIELSASY